MVACCLTLTSGKHYYHRDMATASPPWVTPTLLTHPDVTRTIRLVPLAVAHAAALHASADPELFRYTPQRPGEWSVRGFELDIERICSLPGTAAFAIIHCATGKAIGRSTYMEVRPEFRGVEIGRTWISRAFHGTRVNPEAKYLMLRHAFECLSPPAVRVQITTQGTNLHSQAAIAKLGAVREGVLRKASLLPATPERPAPLTQDRVVFSILDDEWPVVKSRLEERIRTLPAC